MASDESNVGEPARIVGSSFFGDVEIIGPAECPIMARRTIVSTRLFKLLAHEFFPAASDKDPHDHPRAFVTLVWRGGYDDVSVCPRCRGTGNLFKNPTVEWGYAPCGDCGRTGEVVDRVRAPALRYRPATHAHITRVYDDGARTLVVMGPLVRAWGFVREGRWWAWRDYELRFGLGFRCDD